jgi:hypothetical protein
MSPCSSDFIISEGLGAWRKVSEDSGARPIPMTEGIGRPFLLIDCTEQILTAALRLSDEYCQILSVSSI